MARTFPLCKIDFLPLACSFARYSFDIYIYIFFLVFPLFYKKNMNVSWGREILSDYSWHCMFSPQAYRVFCLKLGVLNVLFTCKQDIR